MYKPLTPNDISLRGFPVYKSWDFTHLNASGSGIKVLSGSYVPFTTEFNTGSAEQNFDGTYKRLIFDTINHMYYESGSGGSIIVSDSESVWTRPYDQFMDPDKLPYFKNNLGSEIKLFDVPQRVYGERIKPKSVKITSVVSNFTGSNLVLNSGFDTFVDGLPSNWSIYDVDRMNAYEWSGSLRVDGIGLSAPSAYTTASHTVTDYYIQYDVTHLPSGDALIVFDNQESLFEMHMSTGTYSSSYTGDGVIYFMGSTVSDQFAIDNIILRQQGNNITKTITDDGYYNLYDYDFSSSYSNGVLSNVGNCFYEFGYIVITSTDLFGITNDYTLEFSGSHTIYELEVICNVKEDELNYTQNPTSFYSGSTTYIPLFQHSGSFIGTASWGESPTTMSYAELDFRPFITTIGLYNDDGDLIAVGKFPRPIQKENYLDQAFIVKMDL